DHGTGGCKVTCLNSIGKKVSEANVPYNSYYPHPRWVEQKPEEWIEAAVVGIQKALIHFTMEEKSNVQAIAFSAPHHVAVLLDQDNEVLRNAIMWNDQRTGEETKYLNEKYGKKIYEKTNNYPSSSWTLNHLLWMLKNESHIYKKINKLL